MIALPYRLAADALYLFSLGLVMAGDAAGRFADELDIHVSRETPLPSEDR